MFELVPGAFITNLGEDGSAYSRGHLIERGRLLNVSQIVA